MGMFSQNCAPFRVLYPDTVVGHRHHGVLIRFLGADDDRTAVFPVQDAVLHGVFHQWLKGKGRDHKILCFDLVDHLKFVPKPLLLQV